MTRDEIKLKAANKRYKDESAKLTAKAKEFEHKKNVALGQLIKPVREAERRTRIARADMSRAKLAVAGITPMHTIVTYKGKAYCAKIGANGYSRMLLVRKDNRLFADAEYRADPTPYRMDLLIITNRYLMLGDEK
jgi:hypothetical protein